MEWRVRTPGQRGRRTAWLACTVALACVPIPALGVETVTRAEVQEWLESGRDVEPQFAPGDVLEVGDVEKIRPFVAPGQFSEFQFPAVRLEITEAGDYSPHPVYQNATLQYGGQTSLDEDGSLLNYVAGQPFSNDKLDAADPAQAGFMGAWNSNFRWQHYGQRVIRAQTLFLEEGDGRASDFSQFPPGMIDGGGTLERSVEIGWIRTYMNHLPQLADTGYGFEFSTAKGATFKELTEYYAPFEFRGQKLMVERPLDPHEDDTINAYLPGERKVRRLSAKEKADTWLGSEITFDDFYGFDGHVLDNTWHYFGRRKVLAVMNSKHAYARHGGPHSRLPEDHWELRETIVIEGKPTLKGHPYSSRLLFLDAQNYQMLVALYFDPEGRLMRGALPIYSWSETTEDNPETNRGAHVSMYKGYAFTNFQTGRTTLTNVLETTYPVAEPKKVRRLYRVDNLTAGR